MFQEPAGCWGLAAHEPFEGALQTLLAEALTFPWLVEKSLITDRLLNYGGNFYLPVLCFYCFPEASRIFEGKVLVYLVGWVAPWVTYSLSFPGCSRISYVGLDPFWPLQQVGWSPAHFTASSRRKETFFCCSSREICSEVSLRSSASVFAVLSVHSLQSWSRWKLERQEEFLKGEANTVTFYFAASLVHSLSEFTLVNNSITLYVEGEVF